MPYTRELAKKIKELVPIAFEKELLTKSSILDLMAKLEKNFEEEENYNELTVCKDYTFTYTSNMDFLVRINVSGGHFEHREIFFIRIAPQGEETYVEMCSWCDTENTRLIVPVIYNWVVSL